jgi:hypothetical protein
MKINNTKLLPCFFCGEDSFEVEEGGKIWMGMRYSEPLSYTIRHWCPEIPNNISQPSVSRKGKTLEDAIKEWNTRY